MCLTCGCSNSVSVTITDPETGQQVAMPALVPHGATPAHLHPPHEHEHEHVDAQGRVHRHSHGPGHDHGEEDHGHPHFDGDAHEDHEHGPFHGHGHDDAAALHARAHGKTIALEQQILAKNQLIAERNRGWQAGRELLALNLVS